MARPMKLDVRVNVAAIEAAAEALSIAMGVDAGTLAAMLAGVAEKAAQSKARALGARVRDLPETLTLRQIVADPHLGEIADLPLGQFVRARTARIRANEAHPGAAETEKADAGVDSVQGIAPVGAAEAAGE